MQAILRNMHRSTAHAYTPIEALDRISHSTKRLDTMGMGHCWNAVRGGGGLGVRVPRNVLKPGSGGVEIYLKRVGV